jgi:hypothetical protein
VRAEDAIERAFRPVIEPVPARVEGVQGDDLHASGDRPGSRHARGQRGLACTAPPVDQHDGIGRREGADVLRDQRRRVRERRCDRIITS